MVWRIWWFCRLGVAPLPNPEQATGLPEGRYPRPPAGWFLTWFSFLSGLRAEFCLLLSKKYIFFLFQFGGGFLNNSCDQQRVPMFSFPWRCTGSLGIVPGHMSKRIFSLELLSREKKGFGITTLAS